MDLLVIDVIGNQPPQIVPLRACVRRRHRQLGVGSLEQSVHRSHGLRHQLADCLSDRRGHVRLLWGLAGGWLKPSACSNRNRIDEYHGYGVIRQRVETTLFRTVPRIGSPLLPSEALPGNGPSRPGVVQLDALAHLVALLVWSAVAWLRGRDRRFEGAGHPRRSGRETPAGRGFRPDRPPPMVDARSASSTRKMGLVLGVRCSPPIAPKLWGENFSNIGVVAPTGFEPVF